MKRKWFLIWLLLLVFGFSQTSISTTGDSTKPKFIIIHTDMKPYVDGGMQLVDRFYLVGTLGFYKGENDTYFRLGGGLLGFIKKQSPFEMFIGTRFIFEVNPSVVYGGMLNSRMMVNGSVGGWLHLTDHIALDGRINMNLNFNHYPNNDTVEFGLFTSALGIVFIF
jgi:hypothetical protein